MAVTRRARPTQADRRGPVPADLLDLAAKTWRDADRFAEWLRDHLPARSWPSEDRLHQLVAAGWLPRYQAAATAWAISHGIVDPLSEDRPDRLALRALGVILPVPALHRHAYACGTDLPRSLALSAHGALPITDI